VRAAIYHGAGRLTIEDRPDPSAGPGEIVIRTYERAFLWRRPSGMSVADALRQPPCAMSPA
jgi:hypothetical protein